MNNTTCPECGMLSVFGRQPHLTTCSKPEPVPDHELGPMATAALRRPANHNQLSGEDQWEIDKALGILDWDGDPRK